MRAHPGLNLVSLLGLLVFGLLLATPSPTYAIDLEKYAGIEDDDPDPLPAYASEEDKWLLDELLSQRLIQPLALPGPPSGLLWTPSEYEPLEGVLMRPLGSRGFALRQPAQLSTYLHDLALQLTKGGLPI